MLTQYEEKMTKTVENLEGEYATIRAGRANPNILNKIKVEYYGVPTPMQQLANITGSKNADDCTMGAITGKGDREGDPEFRSWADTKQ